MTILDVFRVLLINQLNKTINVDQLIKMRIKVSDNVTLI